MRGMAPPDNIGRVELGRDIVCAVLVDIPAAQGRVMVPIDQRFGLLGIGPAWRAAAAGADPALLAARGAADLDRDIEARRPEPVITHRMPFGNSHAAARTWPGSAFSMMPRRDTAEI